MDTKNKFFIYARKSTDDLSRQVRSIDDQIAELRDLARRDNLAVADVLIEKQTAKAPGRLIFNAMVERIEKGEASGILAWHPDRLARNSVDGGRIIYLVDTGKIKELKFPTFVFDPSPSGKFMLSIMFGQSKYYVDNLSENIRRGQRQKLKNGIWPNCAPVGYLNDKVTRTIVPDPRRAPLIRRAFELYATGEYTLDRLVETMNALGMVNRCGNFLSRTQYHRLLQNPLYCGIIRYSGEDHEGKHEAIFPKSLFDAVQAVIGNRSKPKDPGLKPYLYRGVFRCGECGAFITTDTHKGHNYLRCTKRVKRDCSQPHVREEAISEQISNYVKAIAIPAEQADWMIAEVEAEQQADRDGNEVCRRRLQNRLTDLDQKLERLIAAYLDQTLSLDEYKTAKQKLVEEKQNVKNAVASLTATGGSWFEPALRFISAAKQARFVAESGRDDEKRDFLKKVGSNLTISNRHLFVESREAWKLVVDQGHVAHHNAAPSSSAAACVGKSDHPLQQAERGRFELPRRFKPPTAFPVLLLQPLGHLSGGGPSWFDGPVQSSAAYHARRISTGQSLLAIGFKGSKVQEFKSVDFPLNS